MRECRHSSIHRLVHVQLGHVEHLLTYYGNTHYLVNVLSTSIFTAHIAIFFYVQWILTWVALVLAFPLGTGYLNLAILIRLP